jgi:hypothetical protein
MIFVIICASLFIPGAKVLLFCEIRKKKVKISKIMQKLRLKIWIIEKKVLPLQRISERVVRLNIFKILE